MIATKLIWIVSSASLTVTGCICYIAILAEQGMPGPVLRPWWRRMVG